MDLDRQTDEQLLAITVAPRAGQAFGHFYERHERLIVAFHMRRVRDPDVAADLTADTFLQALASLESFEPRGEGSGVGWLFGIARFKWLEHCRRTAKATHVQARLQAWSRPELAAAERHGIELCAEDSAIVLALEALPAKQREAVRAYVLEDLSYDEISTRLDSEPATIRKRVSRGLAALRSTSEKS